MPHASRILMDSNESLLDYCLDLHMARTGSCEASQEGVDHLVSVLRVALENWEETTWMTTKAFDDAVKNLIEVTLREWDDYVSREGTLKEVK